MKEYATVRRGFFFVFSGAIFGIRWFESFGLKKNRKWIYGNSKKVRREKSGEILLFLLRRIDRGNQHSADRSTLIV